MRDLNGDHYDGRYPSGDRPPSGASGDTGDRSAIIYSIIASCARRHIDALAYLRDVLSRLPTMTTADDLDALTPARWKPASALVS